MIRTLLFFLLLAPAVFGQNNISTIRGTVRDADSRQPLVGATVSIASSNTGNITGPDGTFRFENLAPGRYQLTVSYIGYQTVEVPEILLESGKESITQVALTASGTELKEATVSGSRPVAVNSVQPITIEQTMRYAATYMDPARVATSFPGVAAANDQANGLVVRGNSPNAMQWRLEGVEIVNPNHLSNAGTFSDRPTSTGGGVNILSTQLLGTSNFLAGPFPAQYGNVNGAVLDMNLRSGNDEKTEFTAQASLLGLDFAAEGPFSKKSKASYLVNYRYSFTGLLGAMGVNFGGEDIRFQDLSFNLNFPTKKGGRFTVFGMGGLSKNTFEAEKDTTTWESQKDEQQIFYKNKMMAAGVTFEQPVRSNLSFRAAVVGSGLSTSRIAYLVNPQNFERGELLGDPALDQTKISFNTTFTYRHNARTRVQAGLYGTFNNFAYSAWSRNSEVGGFALQPFVKWSFQLAPSVSAELGMHALISRVGTFSALPEPRAVLKWQLNNRSQFYASYGLHSQMQTAALYATHVADHGPHNNAALGPTRSHQAVLGYQQSLGKSSSLKLEAYFQHLYKVPVGRYLDDYFSSVNLVEEVPSAFYINRGTARNYGLEASYQKLLTSDFYLLVSGSLYNATYVDYRGMRNVSRFNGRHTFSVTGGKEFRSKNEALWGINAKILWLGGFRDRPIDAAASALAGTTAYEVQSNYTVRLKDYFRPDLRIYRKKSRAKYSTTFAIDLQNVSGTKNEAYRYFDHRQDKVVTQYQLGLIPVVSYRWEF